jgi:hypothetical protein
MKNCVLILAIIFNLNVIYAQQIIIVDQSKSSVFCEGDDVEIFVDADGTNLVYSWYKDGLQIPDESTRFLNIYGLNSYNSGVYNCIVTSRDNSDSARSNDIAVYTATPTRFIIKPYNVKWYFGIDAEFITKLHANDLNELKNTKIQWYKEVYVAATKKNIRTLLNDDKKYSGTKTERLLIKKLVYSDRAFYICIAKGLCGSDSVKAFIGDVSYFKIIKETTDAMDCESKNSVFRVRVEGAPSGTLEYQWFRTGLKKVEESSKFVGTKTRQLAINNVKKDDQGVFYVVVTLTGLGISERSENFILEPKFKPIILIQPKDYIVHRRDNQYKSATYIEVTVSNKEYCFFAWYRNDTLVKRDLKQNVSNYDLGNAMLPPPRPAVKSDVGLYRCLITNECGSLWSDYALVTWGMEDVMECAGRPVSILADNFNTATDSSYYYIWKKNGAVITDNFKFSGSSTYKLTLTDTNPLDSGFYDVWAKNFKTNKETYLGKSYLTLAGPPYVTKELPDTLRYEDADWLPRHYITVFSYDKILYYQLFKDGKAYSNEEYIKINNIYEQYHPFLFGGYVNFPPGKYHYHFRNSCGETDSKVFVIINDFKSGSVKPDTNSGVQPVASYSEEIQQEINTSVFEEKLEINTLSVYPNPANEFIELSINSSDDEFSDIEIYDSFGRLIHKEPRTLLKGLNQFYINCTVLNLSNGVYFIRIKSERRIINGSVVIVK